MGKVFRNAAANVMPYVKSSQFPVVDAYQTEGQVMTNEEYEEQQSSEGDSQWQKQVDDFADKAKDSLSEFGNKVKDATKDIFNSIWGKIQGE